MPLQVLLALLQELLLFVNFDQSRRSLFRTTKRIHQKSFRMALLAFTIFFDSLDDFGRGEGQSKMKIKSFLADQLIRLI